MLLPIYFGTCSAENLTMDKAEIDPASLVTLGNKTYFFASPDIKVVMSQAMDFCNFEGMRLVSFETEEEWTLVRNYLNTGGTTAGVYYWTSGQLFNNEWQWAGSGQKFSYTSWAPGSPNNVPNPPDGDICVCFRAHQDYGWEDYLCKYNFSIICEN